MYTQCKACRGIIMKTSARCQFCGKSRIKEIFDSNVDAWKSTKRQGVSDVQNK